MIVNKGQYHGKLIYLAHTKFDTTYVVHVVSQFMHDLRERYLQVVNRNPSIFEDKSKKGIIVQEE